MIERADVRPVAAGAAAGTATFDLGPDEQTGWGGLVSDCDPGASDRLTVVPTERIEDAVPPTATISLMKMDIEGGEGPALAGCRRLFENRRVKELHFEQNKPGSIALGVAPDESLRLLREFGYDCRPRGAVQGDLVDWVAFPKSSR